MGSEPLPFYWSLKSLGTQARLKPNQRLAALKGPDRIALFLFLLLCQCGMYENIFFSLFKRFTW